MEIKVGFGRADITPTAPVPLGGYGNGMHRIHETVTDALMATCVAITDEQDTTMLLITLDCLLISSYFCPKWREAVSQATGVAAEYIAISATHSHATPEYYLDHPNTPEYRQRMVDGMVACAQAAMADRVPATMACNKVQAGEQNYVRHYRMKDGTYAGDNFGVWTSGIAGHATEPDRQIQILRFIREGAKDILMVNWQAHPCFTGKIDWKNVSADFIGVVRQMLEQESDVLFMYNQGAAGNLNTTSYFRKKDVIWNKEDMALYSRMLTCNIQAALNNLRPIEAGPVKVGRVTVPAKVNHAEDHKVPDAERIMEVWKTGDRDACVKMGRPVGINSPYHAGSLIAKSKMGEDFPFDVEAASVGELGFAWAPYEMFDTNGLYIKENAPQYMTFVCECTNGYYNYLPSKAAYTYGCYERDQCKHAEGTAEMAAEAMTQLLKQQYPQK